MFYPRFALKKNINFAIVKKGDKMAMHGNGIRVGALVLVIALAGVFCFSTWAAEPKTNNGTDADKTARAAIGPGSDNGPGVLEQEQTQPLAKIAKKHFPWLWVAAGVVVLGVVLYFTVIKKPEYKLNVSIGAGVSGYPIAGAFVYKKGKKVRYMYNLGYGYRAMKVMLDGNEVAASGEFTMDRDHVLAVSSEEQFYDLTVTTTKGVTGTPFDGTHSYKEGTNVAYNYALADSYLDLRVMLDGIQVVAQGTVRMDRAHTLTVSATALELADIRGQWHFVIQDAKSTEVKSLMDVSLSGTQTSGHVNVIAVYCYQDTYLFGWDDGNYTTSYIVSSTSNKVNIHIYPFYTSTMWFGGSFNSKNTISGSYGFRKGDGSWGMEETGAWIATRIE
jgi:hypothetical protein